MRVSATIVRCVLETAPAPADKSASTVLDLMEAWGVARDLIDTLRQDMANATASEAASRDPARDSGASRPKNAVADKADNWAAWHPWKAAKGAGGDSALRAHLDKAGTRPNNVIATVGNAGFLCRCGFHHEPGVHVLKSADLARRCNACGSWTEGPL